MECSWMGVGDLQGRNIDGKRFGRGLGHLDDRVRRPIPNLVADRRQNHRRADQIVVELTDGLRLLGQIERRPPTVLLR